MKNLKIVCFFSLILSLYSCFWKNKNTEKTLVNKKENIEKMVGNDKDAHGCIGSAGYIWSVVKNDCIRLFESGQRLNPVEIKKESAVISAFVLISEDKSITELFLPNNKASFILKHVKGGIYKNGIYKFDSKIGALLIDDIVKFKYE